MKGRPNLKKRPIDSYASNEQPVLSVITPTSGFNDSYVVQKDTNRMSTIPKRLEEFKDDDSDLECGNTRYSRDCKPEPVAKDDPHSILMEDNPF